MLSVMTMSTAVEPWVVTLLACVIAGIALLVRFQKRAGVGGGSGSSSTAGSPPPWAPGLRLPLLGHALSYKANPPGFLRAARDAAGPIFRMDLAGLRTTIVASAEAMKQVATEREAVLSARAAVSDFGFVFALGDENVFRGTDIHKRVLKESVYMGSSSAAGSMSSSSSHSPKHPERSARVDLRAASRTLLARARARSASDARFFASRAGQANLAA